MNDDDDGGKKRVPKLRRTIAPTPRSRVARRFRRVVFAAIFTSIMKKKLGELRWGQYVETVDNILLNTVKTAELPSSYLDALASCPLPPGWVTSVLPTELRHQIITYAKNKLVNLLTPVAKRRAHTSQLAPLRDQLSLDATPVSDTLLKNLSPMFDTWSNAALSEILRCGTRRAYRAGMWILPPSKDAYCNVNAMVLLHGSVAEVTLTRVSTTQGDDDAASGLLDTTVSLQPQSRGSFSAPAMIGETRCILATPSTAGYRARTHVLMFEIPYRDVMRVSEEHLQGAHRDKFKKFLSLGRCAQASQSFRPDAEVLSKMRFFDVFNAADNHLLAQSAKPRVAFEKDVVIQSGGTIGDVIIVSRGELEVTRATQQPPPPTCNSLGISTAPTPTPRFALDPLLLNAVLSPSPGATTIDVLRPLSVFGADYLVLEDRCPFSVVATCVTEYWVIPAAALHSVMKNTSQRKLLVDSAARMREHMLTLSKQPSVLVQSILPDVPHLQLLLDMPEAAECVRQLIDSASAKVFKPGDRVVSAGDDVSTLIFVQAGRLHHLAVTTLAHGDTDTPVSPGSGGSAKQLNNATSLMAKKTTVPCTLGASFLLRGRWQFSLTAARLCEAWVIHRQDAWRILRSSESQGVVLGAVRTSMTARSNVDLLHHAASPRAHHSHLSAAKEDVLSTDLDGSQQENQRSRALACDNRAEVRLQKKGEREMKAQQALDEEAASVRRKHRKLAPNIASRVTFVAYEGLHPVRPSAKEAYQAVRRVKAVPPPGGAEGGLSLPPGDAQVMREPTSPAQVSATQRRRSSKSAMMRMERMTVHERVEDELDNQRLKMRRQLEATVDDTTGGAPLSPRRRGGSATAVVTHQLERPSAGKAEKTVLKQILAQHDAVLMSKRAQADKSCDMIKVALSNPFSSIEPHAPVPRLAPTGELVLQRHGRRKTERFNAKLYRQHSTTSYLSAHAFTDL